MKGFLTFIGGVAVGILAVTGVFAMEEEEGIRSVDSGDEGQEPEHVGKDEENQKDESPLIVR
ncbi:MAG: hypothetical protein H0S80_05355 [Desulfovibrionaceae bacterium]|nr:hypothetical protein [Desulfovibrionaceae bacterium]